jgi:hypothetical protein
MLELVLAAILITADPLYSRPLKPGDVIEVWDRAWDEWRFFKVENTAFGLVAVRDDQQFERPIRSLAYARWRWPGADRLAPNDRKR